MNLTDYQPGVCNIGGPEVQRRKQVAQIGAIAFLAFSLFAFYTDLSLRVSLFAFIPAVIASIGYLQSRRKFCLAFGLMGTFNFAELGKISKVATAEAIAADRALALKIIAQSLGLALLLTSLLLLIQSI